MQITFDSSATNQVPLGPVLYFQMDSATVIKNTGMC